MCVFQVESVEVSLDSVQQWIDQANQLLSTHKVDGNINDVEERLLKHQVSIYPGCHAILCKDS